MAGIAVIVLLITRFKLHAFLALTIGSPAPDAIAGAPSAPAPCFFSHVNDAGFWLVKEYFGLSIGQTVKSWSVMETIISVVAGGPVMPLSLVI